MESKSIEIIFDHPVQLADRILDRVTMRRPTLGDAMDHPIRGDFDMKGEAALLSVLCGLKPDEARSLDLFDYRKVQEQLIRFRDGTRSE